MGSIEVSLFRRLNWRLLKSVLDKYAASGPPDVKGTSDQRHCSNFWGKELGASWPPSA